MIAFASPLWLAALGALVVPLAIHLWSHRARRPVRVGSLRLLSGMPPAAARALRLRDPWLLVLRLTVLSALALSLAGLSWTPRAGGAATWALLSEEALHDRALIDSLRDSGAELRLLEDGSRQIADGRTRPASGSLPSARCGLPSSLPSAICHLPNYWSLLMEADRAAPAGTRFVVAAPLVSDRFRGPRPAISAPVTWREVPARLESRVAPSPARPRRVALLADRARRDDARYVEAAIRAAAEVTGIAVHVRRGSVDEAPTLAASADWLILLDGDTAPSGAPVWTDPAGAPVLSVERRGGALAYRWHHRITPDVALAPGFAESVAALWAGADGAVPARRISLAQALPAPARDPARRGQPAGAPRLDLALWLLAALAFALERALAWRRARSRA